MYDQIIGPDVVPVAWEPDAHTLYEHLQEWITDAESELDKDEHLNLCYVSQAGDRISVSDIGYHNPHLIVLYGCDQQGNDCNVLVHMASVQLIVRPVKGTEHAKRRPIGFVGTIEE